MKAGVGIVITRPVAAARELAAALSSRGARPYVFPSLAIEPVEADAALLAALAALAGAAWAIFVSANAAEAGLARVGPGRWPAGVRVAAVGEATAAALEAAGIRPVLRPEGKTQDSDALLAMPPLADVAGRRIVIFRGQGGRERLRETLAARGATVLYAECYRRTRPTADVSPLAEAWARGEIQAVSALSTETLDHFVALVEHDPRVRLADATLVVPHPAIAAAAAASRFARVVVAGTGAADILEALA